MRMKSVRAREVENEESDEKFKLDREELRRYGK